MTGPGRHRCWLLASLLLAPAWLIAQPTRAEQKSRVQEIAFESHGDTLSGTIVFADDRPILAAVVFIQGSGKQLRDSSRAERFARAGIAALVYDKRGAGRSGGLYEGEQSVSGMNIAPLAAQRSPFARFLVMWSGPGCGSRLRSFLSRGAGRPNRAIHLARISRQGYRCARGSGATVDSRFMDIRRQRRQHSGGPVDQRTRDIATSRASL